LLYESSDEIILKDYVNNDWDDDFATRKSTINYLKTFVRSKQALIWLNSFIDNCVASQKSKTEIFCARADQNQLSFVTSSTQRKKSSVQTIIWLTSQRTNSYKENKPSIDSRIAQETAWQLKRSKSRLIIRNFSHSLVWFFSQSINRNLLHLIVQLLHREQCCFREVQCFFIKSLSALSFLDVQDNKSRSVITILSEIMQLLRYSRYKAIASSIFYQKSNLNSCRLNLYHFPLT